jgi:dimeric dUTPase (all-alpha-NTP-PPase superfamily)
MRPAFGNQFLTLVEQIPVPLRNRDVLFITPEVFPEQFHGAEFFLHGHLFDGDFNSHAQKLPEPDGNATGPSLFTRHSSRVLYSRSMENADQLRELFRMQKSLNERIGVQTDGMTEADKTKWLLNYTRAMQQEMAELTDSVPWKWWAKYQKFDEQNARVEVVDLFHFLISMAQVLGMSADDVFAAYVKKNEVNFKRQESGYATKDHDDSKHI